LGTKKLEKSLNFPNHKTGFKIYFKKKNCSSLQLHHRMGKIKVEVVAQQPQYQVLVVGPL
jgi:hypothetical protein